MNILHTISELTSLQSPLVVVAGTFDGVHLGHRALINRAREEAKQHQGKLVVMTFNEHPASFLRPKKAPKLLTSTSQKTKLLQSLGVDILLLLPFNAVLAATTAEQFIHQIVAAADGLKAICVGSSWSFGQGGRGNVSLLRHMGEKYYFSVITIDPIYSGNEVISSTRIRSLITSGDFNGAAICLGYPYALSGRVVHGAGRGKELGFPTANLSLDNMQLPSSGVYLAKASVLGIFYDAIVNIGYRPTMDAMNNTITVEVYLLDFTGDLYGQEMRLEFISFLRKEMRFVNVDALKNQIEKDLQVVKKLLR